MKFEKWQIPTVSTEAVRRLTEAGYPYLVSAVLVSRGITTAADAAAFLAQEHSLIYDPRLMRDMDRAVGRDVYKRQLLYGHCVSPPEWVAWSVRCSVCR